MSPTRFAIRSRGEPAISRAPALFALLLLLVMAVGAYGVIEFNPASIQSGQTTTSSSAQATASTASASEGARTSGLLELFGNFSHLSASSVVDAMDEGATVENVSYAVLGHTIVNSTDYYRVEFMQAPQNTTTILWFDQNGNVSVAEVLGDRNYTGNFASLYSASITYFLSLALIDGNATQLLGLQKTAGDVQQSIGGTQMTVSTYGLVPSNASTIAAETVKVATIPGSNFRLIVYLDQTPVDPTGSSLFFEVNSLST